MNIKFAKFKKLMAALEGIGLIVVGTNAVRSALHGRSPAIADTRTGELVAFAAAPPQEASKPTPAAVVGGGQYSPNVGQTFPDSVYWGVAHVHTGYSFDTGMFGITDQKHQKKGRFATGRACQYGDSPGIGGKGQSIFHKGECSGYFSFPYCPLASFRMVMSGSASFHSWKKSWYAAFALAVSPASA